MFVSTLVEVVSALTPCHSFSREWPLACLAQSFLLGKCMDRIWTFWCRTPPSCLENSCSRSCLSSVFEKFQKLAFHDLFEAKRVSFIHQNLLYDCVFHFSVLQCSSRTLKQARENFFNISATRVSRIVNLKVSRWCIGRHIEKSGCVIESGRALCVIECEACLNMSTIDTLG